MLSRLLDEAIRIPGTDYRFGLDPIIGIVPLLGDSAVSLFSLYIVFESYRVGVPERVITKMLVYIAIDVVFGSIPIIGTLFDAFWKANARNADLLESHLETRAASRRQ